MIDRYSREVMKNIWSPENRFAKWLEIEIAACEALCQLGLIPEAALNNIREKAAFNVKRIDEIEQVTKHDVIAFTTCGRIRGGRRALHSLGAHLFRCARYIFSMLLKEAAEIIIQDIDELLAVLKARAYEHKGTIMVGRTHGVHAEPITFGLKMAVWYDEMQRHRERMVRAKETISYGKISGAVGTFAYNPPFVEEYVCKKCGLKPAPISTQILQRDLHAEYFTTLALIGSSLDKFAMEIRHLQRTEVSEAAEYFSSGQKGSSAMPHKQNPILSENIAGLARILRANALAAMENVALWHERDISHSSVERVIGPDSTTVLDFMLVRFTGLIKNLLVYPEKMEANLNLTKGIFFSQKILLELTQRGLSRETAYQLVQKNALQAWNQQIDFKDMLLRDPEITQVLKKEEIAEFCNSSFFLKNVDTIFARVFKDL